MKTVKIQAVILFFLGLMAREAAAQQSADIPPTQTDTVVCAFNCSNTYSYLLNNCGEAIARNPKPIATTRVNPYVEFDDLISTLEQDNSQPFPLTYVFRECQATCNAASTLDHRNNQVILYNQSFLDQIQGTDQKVKWAVRFIIAHEIGHHLLGHTSSKPINNEDRRKREKRADFFAAFVISLYPESSLDDALAGLASFDPDRYSPKNSEEEFYSTYPTLDNREKAAKEGFATGKSDPNRFGEFRDIRAMALRNFQVNGGSVIFRTLEKQLSMGLANQVRLSTNELLKENNIQQKDLLLRYQSMAHELLGNTKAAINSQKSAVLLKPDDKDQLLRLQDLLLKGNTLQRKEAQDLQKKIAELTKPLQKP